MLFNVMLAGKEGDGKVLVVPKGEFKHELGLQVLSDEAITRILNHLMSVKRDIMVDFGHESLPPISNAKAKAAGWVKQGTYEIRNDGIYALVDWAGEAGTAIENREFKYLSPVFMQNSKKNKNGEIYLTGVINWGLTNNPNMDFAPLVNSQSFINKEEESMDKLLEALRNALGLAADADQQAVMNAISGLKERSDKVGGLEETVMAMNSAFPAMKGLTGDVLVNALNVAAKPPAHSDTEVEGLKNRLAVLEGTEADALVKNAIEVEKKIAPAQKDWAMNYAKTNMTGFKEFLKNAAPLMNTEKLPEGDTTLTGQETSEGEAVRNQLGLSKEQFYETGKEGK